VSTARDRYADMLPFGPLVMGSLHRRSLREQAAAGLDALVALWFDEYDDETDLDPALEDFVESLRGWIDGEAISDLLESTLAGDDDSEET
jgi:hypothetical protein